MREAQSTMVSLIERECFGEGSLARAECPRQESSDAATKTGRALRGRHRGDGVTLMRGDKHLCVNKQIVHMLGYATRSELVGKPVSPAIRQNNCDMVATYVRMGKDGEPGPSRYDFRIVTKTDVTQDVEVSVAPSTKMRVTEGL